jgi:hypothetical protein
MSLAGVRVAFLPTAFPDLLPEPEVSTTSVRFVQTAGGRPGVPAPRRVRDKPFVQWLGPTVWTTLALTISADGTSHGELVGASTFPRHWLYDAEDRLVSKSGLIDFHGWYRNAFGEHSPWGGEDSPAFVVMAESALERQLASTIMRGGARPRRRRLTVGETLVEQGQPGSELYLLLDGVLAVEVDGEHLADVGPGAVVGERAVLEGGRRTATLRASTPCHVAVAASSDVDPDALVDLVAGHRREER